MKPSIRTYLCNDENHRFFGEGPRQLLHAIDETGSLLSDAFSAGGADGKWKSKRDFGGADNPKCFCIRHIHGQSGGAERAGFIDGISGCMYGEWATII